MWLLGYLKPWIGLSLYFYWAALTERIITSDTYGRWGQTVRFPAWTWGWSSSATHCLRDLGHISILLQASIPWVLKGKGDYTRWPMRAIPVVTVSVLNGVSMTPEKRMNPLGWLQWLSHMAGENKEGCSDLWHFWLASVTLYLPFPVILEVALELPKVGVRWALVSVPWFSHSTLSGWTVLGEGVPTCPVL